MFFNKTRSSAFHLHIKYFSKGNLNFLRVYKRIVVLVFGFEYVDWRAESPLLMAAFRIHVIFKLCQIKENDNVLFFLCMISQCANIAASGYNPAQEFR